MSKSKVIKIGLVVEGTTDFKILEAVIGSLLTGRQLIITELQPLLDSTFNAQPGSTGVGWPGVYRWCKQAVADNDGKLSGHVLFSRYDVLVVQIDADVARTTYQKGHIQDASGDLPCSEVCPPCSATTNKLRSVMLRWMGETETPHHVVLCTPAQALESWVLAALFPEDALVQSGGLECQRNPKGQLRNRPRAEKISTPADYEAKAVEVAVEWKNVCSICTEAQRFNVDFTSAFSRLP